MLLNSELPNEMISIEHETLTSAMSVDPVQVTERLRAAVPLADLLGFKVEHLGRGEVVCALGDRPQAANQNGTYQASTFYLLADYTAGLAVAAALPEHSLHGIYEVPGAISLQGWLKDGFVKHVRPATGAIRAEASVEPEKRVRLCAELQNTGRATHTAEVRIYQGETLVALGRHTVVFKKTG